MKVGPETPLRSTCDLSDSLLPGQLWELHSADLSKTRKQRLEAAAARRTAHLRLLLQDVHDPHNISACLRSAEAFGIQAVDIVERKPRFKVSTAAKGVGSWLDVRTFSDIPTAIASLHRDGYAIAVALPQSGAVSLEEIPLDQPLALVFANEHEGADRTWVESADYCFTIPMVGLVESLNVSVSAAVALYSLRSRLDQTLSERAMLSLTQSRELLDRWGCRIAERRRHKAGLG